MWKNSIVSGERNVQYKEELFDGGVFACTQLFAELADRGAGGNRPFKSKSLRV